MSVTELYQYEVLQDQQIRLIQFMEEENGVISGKMQAFDILDKSRPQYRALSYVWSIDGKPTILKNATDTWFMLIDNQRLPILESLRPLFKVLKTKGALKDGIWWWIDCTCINQQDNHEKSHQVPLMGLIYELAEETIIWLGEESYDSDSAMDFIDFLHELLPKASTDQQLQDYFKENPQPAKWKALQNLLLRRWWTRVWTVQEYALAANVSFWCGQKSTSRAAVSNALFAVDRGRASGFDDTDTFYISWNRRRVQLLHESRRSGTEIFKDFPMSLTALAAYTSNNQATNDRDRLYSLLGLTTDVDLLEVDYELSVDETYLRFAQRFIEQYKSLDIICLAHHYYATSASVLPSWVPDWRRKVSPVVVPTLVSQSGRTGIGNLRPRNMVEVSESAAVFAASGNAYIRAEFQGSNLLVYGKIVDIIDGLGASKTSPLVQSSSLRHCSNPLTGIPAHDIMVRVCRAMVFDREDRYLRYPAPIDDFLEDFQRFCSLADKDDVTNLNHEFRDWFARNREFQICGDSLVSIASKVSMRSGSDSASHASSKDTPHQHTHNSFLGRFYDTSVRMTRRLMTVPSGLLGMAPDRATKGDLIVVLFGCNVPVVLRKISHEGSFTLVGECFLEDFMSGEAMEDTKHVTEEFRLC